jgi:hypothetical protein
MHSEKNISKYKHVNITTDNKPIYYPHYNKSDLKQLLSLSHGFRPHRAIFRENK